MSATPVDPRLVRDRKNLSHKRGASPRVEPPVWFMARTTMAASTEVGAFSYFVGGNIDSCSRIGRYCSIAQGVRIGEPGHPVDWLSTSPFQYTPARFGWSPAADADQFIGVRPGNDGVPQVYERAVEIGNDVWIGANAIVLRGITIGDGAIIAAGAVVVQDVEPYSIVGGVPARTIRRRFDDDLIARLLASQWWRFSPLQLSGLPFHDVAGALTELELRIEAGMQPYEAEPVVLEPPARTSHSPTPQKTTPSVRARRWRLLAKRARTRMR